MPCPGQTEQPSPGSRCVVPEMTPAPGHCVRDPRAVEGTRRPMFISHTAPSRTEGAISNALGDQAGQSEVFAQNDKVARGRCVPFPLREIRAAVFTGLLVQMSYLASCPHGLKQGSPAPGQWTVLVGGVSGTRLHSRRRAAVGLHFPACLSAG
ncbi:hypothetical protein HJG60_010450 [Phyllostomus discolor]|uniref:Uncharacterized protein n=1 Tax=Phyllostomus discolor TaxID=89673 RepID=A0A834ARA4_9CHIR|nr:hypothetical protein HJG60_010450 [Phyllostomus discolor]